MKVINPGPRPFWAFGILAALLCCIPLYSGFKDGNWHEAGKAVGYMLGIFAVIVSTIIFVRIEVDEDEIRLRNFGRIQQRARFQDIGCSLASVMAEKDWPVCLTIYAKDEQTVLMTIRLKILQQQDVAWLIDLSELKILW